MVDSGRLRKLLITAVTVAALVTGVLLPVAPAGAHGVPDQSSSSAGSAGPCSSAEFSGSNLLTVGESRQSFVPTRPGLASVDLCISNFVGILGTDFTLNVYAGETNLTAPGTPLVSVPVDGGPSFLSAQWMHVDLPIELATTPGATYVLGVAPAAGASGILSLQWRSTCADSLLTSCAGQPDRYPAGRANDLPANADYGFRTAGLEDADLVGAVSIPPVVCPGYNLAGAATASVTNQSTRSVASFVVDWVWSTDALLDPSDRTIAGSRTTVPSMAAGATASIPPPVLPSDLPQGDGNLLLHLDVDNQVVEVDDGNNLIAGPTTVTACAQPTIANVAVAVVEDQVQTGFNQRQFEQLDPAALASLPQSVDEALAGPAVSPNSVSPNSVSPNSVSPNSVSGTALAPNSVSPNSVSPNSVSPNSVSPDGVGDNALSAARAIRLVDVVAALPPGTADRTLVVNIPIAGDWTARLGAVTAEPVQNITLARALQLLPDLRIGEIDLGAVITASNLALATLGGTLNQVPPPAGQTWCQFLQSKFFSCSATGFDPATMSILALEARGFPARLLPIGNQQLGTVATTGNAVRAFPLLGTPRFNLEHTRLGQLPVRSAFTNPDAIVRCDVFDCSRSLVDAQASGALRDVTVGQVLDGLSAAGRAGGTIGDLAMGTATVSSLRLSSANWNRANSYQIDNACPRMSYRVTGANTGGASAIDPTASVVLAPGFVYVPETATLVVDGRPATTQAEPSVVVAPSGARTYTFALEASIASSFELRFSACASLYLGDQPVGSATVTGVGLQGPYTSTASTATDRVRVLERTPGVTTQALAFADNVVVADHISEAGGYDSWTTPISSTPRTLYMAQLWVPPGADYDLIAFAPAQSSIGFSTPGFAPNSVSPNSVSPNSVSPNSVSPNSVSPNSVSPNSVSPNSVSPNGDAFTNQPDLLHDLPIQELRPGGVSGTAPYAVSAHRGDAPETIFWYSGFGDAGNLTFSVADYGDRDDAPYFFTLQRFAPELDPRLSTCSAAPFPAQTVPASSPAPSSSVTNPRTLFVTNRAVSNAVHGTTATDSGIQALQTLAARTELRGIVLDVSLNRNVVTAYNNWRGDWCNPFAANAAASHIRSLILDYRTQFPTIDTVVIAGGDEIIPDFRLPDTASLGNESQYVTPLLNAYGTNNPVVAAFANATLMSADPYGNNGAIGVGSTFAFLPSAGVSRLPEAPSGWVAAKDQYVAASGNLSPTDALVSGYDGMVDGANAVADVLAGTGIATRRLTDTQGSWTAADFRREAFTNSPDVAGYNAHANHWSILSDSGSDTGNLADAVSSSEAGGIPIGGLIFSNGCHFGTQAPDALNPPPNSASETTRLLDWDQAIVQRRGIAVANSGFGIFDTIEIGQGERLQQLFVQELATAPNASLALARAKNLFFATAGVLDPITYKTVHQLQLYGLGTFKMLGANRDAPPPARPPATPSTSFTTGTYSVAPAGTTTCTDCYLRRSTPNGTAIDLVDPDVTTGHTSVNGYWSAPTSSRRIPLGVGQVSAGLWFTDIQYQRLQGVDPVITRNALSRPDREPEAQYTSVFPTSLGQVVDVGGESIVTLMHGVSRSSTVVDGRVQAEVYLATRISADLFYRASNTTGCIPHVDEVNLIEPQQVPFAVVDVVASELCGPNVRAAALGRDANGNVTYTELGRGANGHWSGRLPLGARDVFVQVFNGRSIGYWHNKGDEAEGLQDVDNAVSIALTGAKTGGIYTGNVQGTIAVAGGATCRVFDNDHLIGTFANGASFTISGEGSHRVYALCSNGGSALRLVAIDLTAPVITMTAPAQGASYRYQQVVPFDVTCADAGSGATCSFSNDGQPIVDGQPLRTDTVGTHTVAGTATDGAGRTTTISRTYTVTSRYQISTFMSPIAAKPTINQVSKSSNVTVKFTVIDSMTGQQTTDVSIIASRLWYPINCTSKARTGAGFFTTGTTPEYSGGTFHFNIDAPSPVGNCYELVVTLVDGTSQSAYFKTKN